MLKLHKVKSIDLAIIIPTLNEERYIGRLLDSIYFQTVHPKEICVVDAFSEDGTIEEIKRRHVYLKNLKFYQIEKSTTAKQRNFGVKKTKSKHILFLDADMLLLNPNTLKSYMEEIYQKKPDSAAAFNYPLSDLWKDKLFFYGMNLTFFLVKPFWPMANGMNQYIRRDVFMRVGGYDEKVRLGEDSEIIQKIADAGGKFIYLTGSRMYTSVRRYVMEGRRNYILKMIRSIYYITRYGYRYNPVEYKYGCFKTLE